LLLFPGIKLRPYQIEGVNWLVQCYEAQHGCILGDEMGLGKTCQVCLLVFLLENGLCLIFFFLAQCFCRIKKYPNGWLDKQPHPEVHAEKREIIVSFIS